MPGFLALLALLFIGLKLTGVITWTWWLVLLPLYGPLALVLAVLAAAGVGLGVGTGLLAMISPKRRFSRF